MDNHRKNFFIVFWQYYNSISAEIHNWLNTRGPQLTILNFCWFFFRSSSLLWGGKLSLTDIPEITWKSMEKALLCVRELTTTAQTVYPAKWQQNTPEKIMLSLLFRVRQATHSCQLVVPVHQLQKTNKGGKAPASINVATFKILLFSNKRLKKDNC